MDEMKIEKRPDDMSDAIVLDAKQQLEEIFGSYAWMVSAVMMATVASGRVELRDLTLAKEMVETLTAISSLIEKERKRSSDRQEDFAKRSWR